MISSLFTSRRARAAALLPLLPLLAAARMSVGPLPETMVPVEVPSAPIGDVVTVKEGDVVLRAKVYDTEVAFIDEPVSVAIAKFSHDMEAGTKLDPVLVSDKTERLTGASGRIYCGENQRTRSKFGEAMLGDMFSKYEVNVRFCFVDSDQDGKLDRVFLGGAKDEADQEAREIEPVAFTSRMFEADDDAGEIEMYVKRLIQKRGQEDKIEFGLRMTKNGVPLGFSYIMTISGGKAQQTYPTFKTNPKKVPYPSQFTDVLGSTIAVHGVDAAAGTAQIMVKRPFAMQLFKPVTIQVQYVYIYY